MDVLLPVSEAAERLDVSRRRAQALVEEGRLRARRVGRQWAVPAADLRIVANTLQAGPGRPLSPAGAWSAIAKLGETSADQDELDRIRRSVRSRADHRYWYVHPGLHEELHGDRRGVLGGRQAAVSLAAVDAGDDAADLYIKQSDATEFANDYAASDVVEGENVRAHVVPDDVWPFEVGQRYAGLWVAWLDLADVLDRAADTVLDRLIGGRLVG